MLLSFPPSHIDSILSASKLPFFEMTHHLVFTAHVLCFFNHSVNKIMYSRSYVVFFLLVFGIEGAPEEKHEDLNPLCIK